MKLLKTPKVTTTDTHRIRNMEIFRLFCGGAKPVDIANELGISFNTVKAVINHHPYQRVA